MQCAQRPCPGIPALGTARLLSSARVLRGTVRCQSLLAAAVWPHPTAAVALQKHFNWLTTLCDPP